MNLLAINWVTNQRLDKCTHAWDAVILQLKNLQMLESKNVSEPELDDSCSIIAGIERGDSTAGGEFKEFFCRPTYLLL